MIRLDPNRPYSEVLGATADGCRYRQGKYRFKADGTVIGDSVKLEMEAKQEKMAILKAQMDAHQAEIDRMNEQLASQGEQFAALESAPVPSAPVAPGVHFQTSPNPTQQPAIAKPAGVLPIAPPVAPAAPAPMVPPVAVQAG